MANPNTPTLNFNLANIYTPNSYPHSVQQAQQQLTAHAANTTTPATTIQGHFNWRALPVEIRRMILEEVVGHPEVSIDARRTTRVRIDAEYIPVPMGVLNPHPTPGPRFLAISREFFAEVREVFWRRMHVRFEHRWELVNSFLNGSVEIVPRHSPPTRPHMFPQGSHLFSHVVSLEVNLTRRDDFLGAVTNGSARQVTSSILTIIDRHLISLRHLTLHLDDYSRISEPDRWVFLPHPWFLEQLAALHLHTLTLLPGTKFRGQGSLKTGGHACIRALAAVFARHLETSDRQRKLTYPAVFGDRLQGRVGRKMLAIMRHDGPFNAAFARDFPRRRSRSQLAAVEVMLGVRCQSLP